MKFKKPEKVADYAQQYEVIRNVEFKYAATLAQHPAMYASFPPCGHVQHRTQDTRTFAFTIVHVSNTGALDKFTVADREIASDIKAACQAYLDWLEYLHGS